MANSANDAWFLDTSAVYKHFCASIFRAVETRKTIVMSSTTGVSAFINPSGKIEQMLDINEKGLVAGPVKTNEYKTFYVKHGDIFIIFCAVFLFVSFAFVAVLRTTKKKFK